MQKLLFLALISLWFLKAQSQITITGYACVTKGTQYQYFLGGTQNSSPVQVCVTGGILLNDSSCMTDSSISQFYVTWNNDTTTVGTITVTASSNSQTLNTTLAPQLFGGNLDTSVKTQFIDSGVTPSTINCSVASGGSCSPSYNYQWQQSPDNMTWVSASGATSQNLSFDSSVTQVTYYRRQVTEGTSGSIGYSDVAVVFPNSSGGSAINLYKLAKEYCMVNRQYNLATWATGFVTLLNPKHS